MNAAVAEVIDDMERVARVYQQDGVRIHPNYLQLVAEKLRAVLADAPRVVPERHDTWKLRADYIDTSARMDTCVVPMPAADYKSMIAARDDAARALVAALDGR